jgi:hypothetical protein
MKSKKFIEKYIDELWNICENAAKEMYPHIKQLGLRDEDKSYYDDAETIFDVLLTFALEEVIDNGEPTFTLATGCYQVIVSRYKNKISVDIQYELQSALLELK